jgi:hypothetical protein
MCFFLLPPDSVVANRSQCAVAADIGLVTGFLPMPSDALWLSIRFAVVRLTDIS